jgi:hypothetical protein
MSARSKDNRYRKTIHFQLDLNKPGGQEIAQHIQDLKRERAYSKAVRDGIRLVVDLQKGRLDVLQELFPWVIEKIAAQPETLPVEALEKVASNTEDAFRRHIEQLENLILQQGAVPVHPGQKPSEVKPPVYNNDDFDLEITRTGNTENNNSSWNFMIASSMQVYGNCDSLPPQIVDYGLRTGRIPADMVKRKPMAKSPPKVAKSTHKKQENPGKIAGADTSFISPEFDDLDDYL